MAIITLTWFLFSFSGWLWSSRCSSGWGCFWEFWKQYCVWIQNPVQL